ncbi:MAG: DNA replication/repair protein RecF [Gammaproteobacteria bacterium]
MKLQHLRIDNVRKIQSAKLDLHPHLNLIIGANGSGKTSALEALYLLSGGRSFRTTRAKEIISYGAEELTVFGESASSEGQVSLGIEKTNKSTRFRLNGENVSSASTIVRKLPMLVLNSESFRLLEGGPSNRRDLLDRVLFHVEQNYLDDLRKFYQILKQRNASIRNELPDRDVTIWNRPLIEAAEKIDALRRNQLAQLTRNLENTGIHSSIGKLELAYEAGWSKGISLESALARSSKRDRMLKTTTVGPHRAEVKVLLEGRAAKTCLSRGQTKLTIAALISAIAKIVFDATNTPPILLVDDLGSELDASAKSAAIQLLTDVKVQAFFTAIEYNMLPDLLDRSAHMFHVEQGRFLAD